MNKSKVINVLKSYVQSEESSVRVDNPSDLIAIARDKISPDQSNALDREIKILEELINDLDIAFAQ